MNQSLSTLEELPPLPPETLEKLRDFARANKGMFWDVKIDKLSESAIVERVMTLGSWKDFFTLQYISHPQRVRMIFRLRAHMPRSNFRPETISLFDRYYANHPTA